tara:strand:+ start:5641 stop:5793 length:153 start_codon:yes stop_codon:yes gene_type:complete
LIFWLSVFLGGDMVVLVEPPTQVEIGAAFRAKWTVSLSPAFAAYRAFPNL